MRKSDDWMSDPLMQRAALTGWAQNPAVPTDERLAAALQVIEMCESYERQVLDAFDALSRSIVEYAEAQDAAGDARWVGDDLRRLMGGQQAPRVTRPQPSAEHECTPCSRSGCAGDHCADNCAGGTAPHPTKPVTCPCEDFESAPFHEDCDCNEDGMCRCGHLYDEHVNEGDRLVCVDTGSTPSGVGHA